MATLSELVAYCDMRTQRIGFRDFPGANNGLQFENSGKVSKIGIAVDASASVFEEATRRGIDFLLVHHGMFWHAQHPVTGTIYRKFKQLFDANLAVYSSHLPLDAHREIGNNALLARALGVRVLDWGLEYEGNTFAAICSGMPRETLRGKLQALFPDTFKAIEFGSENPGKITLLCGSGNTAVPALESLDCDTLVCGELKQEYFTAAQERKFNLYPCGHYATEKFGILALGKELAEKFSLPFEFIETGCPL